jgi:hypothetical protein
MRRSSIGGSGLVARWNAITSRDRAYTRRGAPALPLNTSSSISSMSFSTPATTGA